MRNDQGQLLLGHPPFRTGTDEEGSYSFDEVPPGEWYIGATGDLIAWKWVGLVTVEQAITEEAPDVVLPPIGGVHSLHGVVRWPDGRGVAGAVVRYRPMSGGAERVLDADVAGEFATQQAVADGEYELHAAAPKHVPGVGSATAVALPGTDIELVLPEHPVLEIEVVDESGRPVMAYRWKIGLADESAWGGVRWLSGGESAPSGPTRITWLTGSEMVEVQAEGYQPHREELASSEALPLAIRILLKGGYHIAGHLVGVPADVSEVIVQTVPMAAGSTPDQELPWRVQGVGSKRVRPPWAFDIQVRAPGTYAIGVSGEGIADIIHHPVQVGDPPGAIELVLAMSTGAHIRGSVWCESDRRPSTLRVSLSRDLDSTHEEARVGADHSFEFRAIPTGLWWLRVLGTDGKGVGAPRRLYLLAGAVENVEFDLRLPPRTVVRGRLRLGGRAFGEGIPSRGLTTTRRVNADWKAVLFVDDGLGQQLADTVRIGADGRFEVSSEEHGGLELRLAGDAGHRSWMEFVWSPLPVDMLDPLEIDIAIGRVVLHSTELSVKELSSITMLWESPSHPNLRASLRGRFASNGYLVFPNVPAGELTITMPPTSDGTPRPDRMLILDGGGDVTLDLDS